MAQVKIYGERSLLAQQRTLISDAIHAALVEVFGLPEAKRFQRFIGLDAQDFIYPADRSARYIIVEILLFAGRSTATKKALIRRLYALFQEYLELEPADLEIVLLESPRDHWGIRGLPGDELQLNYLVEA